MTKVSSPAKNNNGKAEAPANGTLLAAALEALDWGWSIIPISVAVGVDEKKPAKSWEKYQHERPSRAMVQEWCRHPKVNGIAVVCGEISGDLVCRDFDDASAYHNWQKAHPDIAATLPTAKTARGYHVYFRNEQCKQIIHLADGSGELRGAGFCLLPPSIHPTSMVYTWLIKHTLPIPIIDDPAGAGLVPMLHKDNVGERKANVRPTQGELNAIAPEIGVPNSGVTSGCEDSETRINHAIAITQPTEFGQRHRQIFELARMLKAISEVASLPGEKLFPIFRRWHTAASPHIKTKDFDLSWMEFLDAWENVRIPAGQSFFETVIRAVDVDSLPECVRKYQSTALCRLAGLCRALQQQAGDEPFFLGCRKAAEIIGLASDAEQEPSHMTAWRYFKLLQREGVLVVSTTGTLKGKRSTYWKWRGEE